MLHLNDTCKREAKSSRFVNTDTYAAIKETGVVDHNFSFKDALCLAQQLSLISFRKRCPLCAIYYSLQSLWTVTNYNFVIVQMADVLTAFINVVNLPRIYILTWLK